MRGLVSILVSQASGMFGFHGSVMLSRLSFIFSFHSANKSNCAFLFLSKESVREQVCPRSILKSEEASFLEIFDMPLISQCPIWVTPHS